ncbi:hypothetical protein HUG17_2079 [Dermatophagoides farinae]|uniref:Uncharacterized protein n=1 Tax=Dermatophagoides farinae TaxID=6954 RepID=A0A9D4P8A4_DERFA|nr:uncharacterized protein LOC124498775 [Dermatophagoides farinae]KAH7646541.1 hypothetical protein HUG17_2079 [Dermatophagoides farinae]
MCSNKNPLIKIDDEMCNNSNDDDIDDRVFRTTNLVFWPLLRRISKEFLQNVKQFQIFHNGQSAIFLHQDGIFVYGDNFNGWFGLSNHVDRVIEHPLPIDQIFKNEIKTIQIGSNFIILLTNSGYIYGCGSNSHGQIGLKNVDMMKQFTLIRERIKFVKIACGSLHVLALDIFGNVWSWGDNEFNQCSSMRFKFLIPTKLLWPKFQNIQTIDIACGYTSSIILNSDGNVYVLGRMASIYFMRPTRMEIKLKPNTFIKKIYGCRDICALQTNHGEILHCFKRNEYLEFQKIDTNIQAISTHWNNNQIILYSKSEKRCYVWNYDNPESFATNSDSIPDITNLYVHPNTPGLIKLPLDLSPNTDFNDPTCSDLELLITDFEYGELPRTLYVQRAIIMKHWENLLNYSVQSPTNTDRIMIDSFPYSFLFQYIYFIYNGNYQTLWRSNLDDKEYFEQKMLLQDLLAHYSLNDSLHETLQNIILERLNEENYIQVVSLQAKYQSTLLCRQSVFLFHYYVYMNIQNCGKFFEDSLRYNQPQFIERIFRLLYNFININYRYLEEKLNPYLCKYYKQELFDGNDELYYLAIRYDPEKRDCIRFMNDNVVTISLLQIYKSCFMYRRYDLIPEVLKRIKFCMRKHLANVFYFYLFSLDYKSYGGLFDDHNHRYLHQLVVAFIKNPENFEITRKDILEHVLAESNSNANLTYFIKAKLFQLNDDFRWLESVTNFSGQETLMIPAIYCQFYSLAKNKRDEKILKTIKQHLSSDLFVNFNTLPLIFLLALFYEDEQLKLVINERLSTDLDSENILIVYKIVHTYIDDDEFSKYLCSLFIKHINMFNCIQLYELIQQYKDSLALTILRPNLIKNFDSINLSKFAKLAMNFHDQILLSHIQKFILTNCNKKNGTDFYKLIMRNSTSFSNDFIQSFRNVISKNLSSENIIDFIIAASNHLDTEMVEKLWKLAHDYISATNCLRFYEMMIQKDFFDQCLQLKISMMLAKTVNVENFERIYVLAIKANDESLINQLNSSIVKKIMNKENCIQLYRFAMKNSDHKLAKNIGMQLKSYLTVKNCLRIYIISYENDDSFVRKLCARFLASNPNGRTSLSIMDKQVSFQLKMDLENFNF